MSNEHRKTKFVAICIDVVNVISDAYTSIQSSRSHSTYGTSRNPRNDLVIRRWTRSRLLTSLTKNGFLAWEP